MEQSVQCPICYLHVLALHPNSHIIPKWMEEGLYDGKGRTLHIFANATKKQRRPFQQSCPKASIVCHDCEARFAKSDKYAADLFKKSGAKSRSDMLVTAKLPGAGQVAAFRFSNFDYPKLQNFVFSVLLRGHLYSQRQFNQTLFTPQQLNRLRETYLGDQTSAPSPDLEFPIRLTVTGKVIHFLPAPLTDSLGRRLVAFHGYNLLFVTYLPDSDGEKMKSVYTVALKAGADSFVGVDAADPIFISLLHGIKKA